MYCLLIKGTLYLMETIHNYVLQTLIFYCNFHNRTIGLDVE
jgi:hypothetical protein